MAAYAYKVVTTRNQDELEKQITNYLKQGWKLTGGISIVSIPQSGANTIFFSQAIYM